MLKRKNILLSAVIVLLLATSCASRKKTVAPAQPQAFEWMTSNMDIQAEGNSMSFNDLSGQLRIRHDSIVWLSVTATMGVEVLRAKISTDSIWVLNRLEKSYLAEHIDSLALQLGLPLSLPWVQTMLLDNNQGAPPVENQTVLLKTVLMGGLSAKIRYNNIRLDEKTSFPLKITDKMERIRIKPRNGN